MSNDSDPDGDALSVSSFQAEGGTAELQEDGRILFTEDDDEETDPSLSYTISDVNGLKDSANVTFVEDVVAEEEEAETTQTSNSNDDDDDSGIMDALLLIIPLILAVAVGFAV